ncbi:hypothetical protein ACFXTH_041770 [Malus domestica]
MLHHVKLNDPDQFTPAYTNKHNIIRLQRPIKHQWRLKPCHPSSLPSFSPTPSQSPPPKFSLFTGNPLSYSANILTRKIPTGNHPFPRPNLIPILLRRFLLREFLVELGFKLINVS